MWYATNMPTYPHADPHGLVPDIARLVRDIAAACRKDSDGGTVITGRELVRILESAGIVVVDLAVAAL